MFWAAIGRGDWPDTFSKHNVIENSDAMEKRLRQEALTAGEKQDMKEEYDRILNVHERLFSCACCGERKYKSEMKVFMMPIDELELLMISQERSEEYK